MAARRGVAPFALAAVLLAAAFVATYLFFVRTYVGQIVDERAFVGASGQHDAVYRVAGLVLGNVPTVAVGGGILVTLIIGIVTRRFRHLTVALGVGAVAVAAAELAKHVFLERAATGATDLLDNSFPSGHATVAAAAAFAVFVVSPPRWRPLAAALGGAFAVLTGIGLVIQQWHRPSDVVAAFMLVAACGCFGGIALLLWRVPEAVPRRGRCERSGGSPERARSPRRSRSWSSSSPWRTTAAICRSPTPAAVRPSSPSAAHSRPPGIPSSAGSPDGSDRFSRASAQARERKGSVSVVRRILSCEESENSR